MSTLLCQGQLHVHHCQEKKFNNSGGRTKRTCSERAGDSIRNPLREKLQVTSRFKQSELSG